MLRHVIQYRDNYHNGQQFDCPCMMVVIKAKNGTSSLIITLCSLIINIYYSALYPRQQLVIMSHIDFLEGKSRIWRYLTSPRESIQPITVEILHSYRLKELQMETRIRERLWLVLHTNKNALYVHKHAPPCQSCAHYHAPHTAARQLSY